MKIKVLLFFIFVFSISLAQNKKEIALQKGKEAIKLMDEGKIEESISLLEESQKLDPEDFNYPYEIAYANYLNKNYKKSIEILEKLERYKNTDERLYALWGNSYDMMENPTKAIEIYDLGIKKFPNKGLLYLEKGVVYEFEKKYNEAVQTYQKGISVEPKYPSNYYRLAKLYLNSADKTPGLIYGEIFVNLERTTNRTKEISEKLFEEYKNSVVYENGQWKQLNLCKQMSMNSIDTKLPFCMLFGKHFIVGLLDANSNQINLNSLSKIRQEFLKTYFKQDYKDYPNILFEYQKQMMDNEIFDAYNHYIFQMGAKTEFADWLKANEESYKKFVEWYTKTENIINPSKENYWNFKY